jgi:hypothetical protein
VYRLTTLEGIPIAGTEGGGMVSITAHPQ